MKKFVDKKISGTEFSDQFFQTWKSDRDKTYNSEELVYIRKFQINRNRWIFIFNLRLIP